MTRAATWNRVSHKKEETILANMVKSNREYVLAKGWTLVKEYQEILTSKGITPGLKEFIEDAETGAFDVAVFGALSRMTRGGIEYAINILNRLENAGIVCHFVEQAFFNTDSGAPDWVRKGTIGFIAEWDKEYRARISRATKKILTEQKAAGTYRGGAGSHKLPCKCAIHR